MVVRPFHALPALALVSLVACDRRSPQPLEATPVSAPPPATTSAPAPSGAKPVTPESLAETSQIARKLAGSILVGGETMKTLVALSDAYGPRLTGSDVYARSAGWAVDRFRAVGVDATLEPFTVDHSWARGEAKAKLVPSERSLHVAAFGWTPGTPAGGVRAEVVRLADLSKEVVDKRKSELKGKIVFAPHDALSKVGKRAHPSWDIEGAGAAALVYGWHEPHNALFGTRCRGPKAETCPKARFFVGSEDAAYLERQLDAGPVTMELVSTAVLGGPVEVPNVVAELKGSEKPEEIVIVGAHLDSWDLATGAQDNGSGAAQVIEAARAIRALGKAPRRTLRFVLWSGEEEGLLGSRAYVKAHAKELDRIVAYLNTDYGAGAPIGWDIDGRPDVMEAIAPVAKTLLADLGGDTLHTKMRCDTDHCPFWLEGVPALNLDVDISKYEAIHHLATDTVEKVKSAPLASGAAVLAITAYAIADRAERLAPRLDHAGVAAHLKESDLLPDLTDSGFWRP